MIAWNGSTGDVRQGMELTRPKAFSYYHSLCASYMYMYMYVYTNVCMYVCMYIYIYIYIYIHIYIYIYRYEVLGVVMMIRVFGIYAST